MQSESTLEQHILVLLWSKMVDLLLYLDRTVKNNRFFFKFHVILGKRTIPSVVAYNETEILVGNAAITCSIDPSNILYGML